MNQRHLQILELISEHKKIDVTTLSSLCKVSQVTIRKDLIELEGKGLLKREHGYAIVNNEDDINYRLSFHYEIKYHIALKALATILPQETVMIESGSTCTLLALEIAKANRGNTIITNSVFIARYIKDYPETKVILLGGSYQTKSETIVGSAIKESLHLYHVNKLFIGTDGIDEQLGCTGSDLQRCEVVKEMKEHSDQVYVLTENKKFNKKSNYRLLPLDDVDYIVCNNMSSEQVKLMEKYKIKII